MTCFNRCCVACLCVGVHECCLWAARSNIHDFNSEGIKPTRAKNTGWPAAASCSSAATPWLSCTSSSRRQLWPSFSNPRVWGERGGRWDSTLVTPGMGNEGWLRRPWQPWLWRPAARGELCSGRESEGCRFGKVEEGV